MSSAPAVVLSLICPAIATLEIVWNHVLHDPKDRRRVVDSPRCDVRDDQMAHEIAERHPALNRPLGEIRRGAAYYVLRFYLVTAESLRSNSFVQALSNECGVVSL